MLRSFDYDSNGNCISHSIDGSAESYTYGIDSNQLQQRGLVDYQLDESGNTLSDHNPVIGQRHFSYNVVAK